MEIKAIEQDLKKIYQNPLKEGFKRRIVVWHDQNEDFKEELVELEVENVTTLTYTYDNAFKVRYQIEKELADQNILLYVPREKNESMTNPLVDVYLYAEHYLSDATALMLREFNLSEQYRDLVEEMTLFFKTADNRKRFAKLLDAYKNQNLTPDLVENCLLAVLCRQPYADFNDILIAVFQEEVEAYANASSNKLMEAFEKRGVVQLFWKKVSQRFGYYAECQSVSHFLKSLFATYLLETMSVTYSEWEVLALEHRQNARIFMEERLLKSSFPFFEKLSYWMADALQMKAKISNLDVDHFKDSGALAIFTEKIIDTMVQEIKEGIHSPRAIRELIQKRQTMLWEGVYALDFECVLSALDLLDAIGDYQAMDSQRLFKRYVERDYLVDQAYRHFYTAYHQLETVDRLKPLKELVESRYVGHFMIPLSQNWNEVFADADGRWEIEDVLQQTDFSFNYLRPDGKNCKVVIISDGLRYEAAEELKQRLLRSGIKSSNLSLIAYQSVMPSITELGMAALLPHSHQIILDEAGTVFVKGINSNGLSNRRKILNPESGRLAYEYSELAGLTQKEFRKKFTDANVVYIYHNVIDGRGDNAKTEAQVFEAVQKSYEDLEKLLKSLNQIKRIKDVYITADHGFLYQESPLIEADKLPTNKSGVIKAKRRYLISKTPLEIEGTMTFEMSKLAGQQFYVTVPKGQQRFKMQGAGVNYVHGGAMPQEFVVPLLSYKPSVMQDIDSVNVICRVLNKRITAHEVRLDFIQTEILAEGKSPTWVRAYFEDSFGELVSNVAIFLCDSTSDKIDERTYRQNLVIMNREFLLGEELTLVVENEWSGEEFQRLAFMMDL